MNRTLVALVFITIALLFSNCKSKSKADVEETESYNYPVTILPDSLSVDVMDNTTLYPLSEEFMESFVEKCNNYAGHKITARVPFPEKWGVRCLERLPQGRELLLLQSESREWMYLVVTSGFGTQRILDLIPVAIDVSVQNNDVLETEKWKMNRRPDGSFIITKEYEWIKSLTKATKQDYIANPDKYRKSSLYVDQYSINESGRFEYTEVVDSIPDHRTVIFFYNKNEKPASWDDCVDYLQAFCEDNNIYYESVYQNYDNVVVRDFNLQNVITVDINPYIGTNTAGMVLIKKDGEPKCIHFGSMEYLQMEIKRYFSLTSQSQAL
ncbi:MAG: hypothetical protein MJZ39_00060 [Bacteroidales bacterium]|nr:hypothetical protein [Bacteroidales bacterium]